MAEYILETDVKKRCTKQGYRFAADRDGDDTVTSTEEADYVTTAIQYAGALLDEAVTIAGCEPSDARGQSNQWLKDRALDIAVYRTFTNGGRDAPESVQRAYDDALEALERVRGGGKIPGLTFPYPFNRQRSSRLPHVVNPR